MDNLPIMSNIMEKGLNYMKYDLSQKLSRGAVRTINAFTGSMFSLLSEKSFESVSVNEICLQSGYPRATFYNYFDDKYDLLTCCWIKLAQAIGFEEFKSLSDSGRKTDALYLFADRVYDLGSANLPLVQKIVSFNNETGYMFTSLKFFMGNKIREMLESGARPDIPVPKEILAAHHSNTLILVMEYAFANLYKCSKEDVKKYLGYFLGSV